jgi:hypothetical protein
VAKPLGDEIYVASEPSATPLQSYAPLSNFSTGKRVSLPWTQGTEVLSSPDFPRRIAINHLIPDGFSS